MTMIAITEECFFSSAEYAHLVWTGGVTAEHDDAAKAPPADDDDDDNDDDERSSFGSHHHPPYTSSTYYQQQHHEPVLQPLLEEEAAAALAAGGGGGSGGAFDLPITIAPPPPTPAMDSRRGGVGGHRSTSPLRHAHAPMPLRPPPTWSGAVLPSHDPAASGRSSASESAPVSQAALTAPAAPPRSSTASPVSLPLSTSPGPSSGGGGGSGAFPLRDPTEPGNPPPMLLKRSASGSRVMSHKLKSLLQAVEASELAAAPTEGCRSASVTPTAAVAMGAGGGGASGGERRGSVPGGSVEEGQGGGGAPSAAAVAEALDELQAQLLRQLNAGRGEEGAGAGMGAVDAGAGGSNSAGAVLQAIAATRDRLLVRRRRAPSSRLATQPEEGEEGEG